MNRASVQGVQTVTAVTSTVVIGRKNVLLTNSGSKTVFIRLNGTGALTTDYPILTLGQRTLSAGEGSEIYSVSAICGGADASTLDYLGFD